MKLINCFLLLLFVVSCGEDIKKKTCKYDGVIYNSGDSVPAIDGCNTCKCEQGGVISGCTELVCISVWNDSSAKIYIKSTSSWPGKDTSREYEFTKQELTKEQLSVLSKFKVVESSNCHEIQDGESFYVEITDEDGSVNKYYDNRCGNSDTDNIEYDILSQFMQVSSPQPKTCTYNGIVYSVGDSIPVDSCSTCLCNEDGTVDSCTDSACFPAITFIEESISNLTTADYTIDKIRIDEDLLTMVVTPDSGCNENIFKLFANKSFMESNPVQINVLLHHEIKGNIACTEQLAAPQTVMFDLTKLKEVYKKSYGQSGTIIMNFAKGKSIAYTFGSCNEGAMKCNDDNLYTCNSKGKYELTQNCGEMGCAQSLGNVAYCETLDKKPNIYLYPEKEMDINVKVLFPNSGEVVVSEPFYDYSEGWDVTVDSKGRIDNKWEYLFYESKQPDFCQYESGWVVPQSDLEPFFRKNMSDVGFAGREIEDFIEWWIPLLKDYPYYAIYPQFDQQIKKMTLLSFSVNPDSLLRYRYSIEGLSENIELTTPEAIVSFNREGFVVTEWGVMLRAHSKITSHSGKAYSTIL